MKTARLEALLALRYSSLLPPFFQAFHKRLFSDTADSTSSFYHQVSFLQTPFLDFPHTSSVVFRRLFLSLAQILSTELSAEPSPARFEARVLEKASLKSGSFNFQQCNFGINACFLGVGDDLSNRSHTTSLCWVTHFSPGMTLTSLTAFIFFHLKRI